MGPGAGRLPARLAGDRRAFEALVLLLNHRDPQRCASAAHALARLGDPRTARAAAALATNELRVAYALHPVRLLAELRAPESVPALITTLERRLRPHDPHRRVALACVEGLGTLGDARARPVLNEALRPPGARGGGGARAGPACPRQQARVATGPDADTDATRAGRDAVRTRLRRSPHWRRSAARAYRTSGTATPSASKGSSAPSAREARRS